MMRMKDEFKLTGTVIAIVIVLTLVQNAIQQIQISKLKTEVLTLKAEVELLGEIVIGLQQPPLTNGFFNLDAPLIGTNWTATKRINPNTR